MKKAILYGDMENKTASHFIVIDQNDVDEFNKIYKENHPRAKNLPIKSPQHPSINTYMTMNNQASNRLKQNWKQFIVWVLGELNMTNKKIEKCRITYRTYFPQNRRRDLDNISPKFILDGFVEAGFIVDDSSDHVISLTTECYIDKEYPRIEFLIEVIE